MRGTRSSRKLEQACRDQLPYRWLTGWQRPDHTTLWRFSQAHRQAMRRLLTRTVRVAVAAGLVDPAVQTVADRGWAGGAVGADPDRDRGPGGANHRGRRAAAGAAAAAAADAGGAAGAGPGGAGAGACRGWVRADEPDRPGRDAPAGPERGLAGRGQRPGAGGRAGDPAVGGPGRARRAADHGSRCHDRPRRPRAVGPDGRPGDGGDRDGADPVPRGWRLPLGRAPGGLRRAAAGRRAAGPAGARRGCGVPHGPLRP
jgi:Transposase domain (DUF772)